MKACAEETRSFIISEIGERNFAVLVDESRDKSIKEQNDGDFEVRIYLL